MLTSLVASLGSVADPDRWIERILRLELGRVGDVVLAHVLAPGQDAPLPPAPADVARLRARPVVLRGDPAEALARCAQEVAATAIAVPRRAEALLARLPAITPVPLVVADPDDEVDRARRVVALVTLDAADAEAGGHVLAAAGTLARRLDAVVLLLAVVDPAVAPAAGAGVGAGAAVGPGAELALRRRAEEALDAAHTRLGGAAALRRVVVGDPAAELVRTAADDDLVVLDARRCDAAAVGRLPCPAVLVPPRA